MGSTRFSSVEARLRTYPTPTGQLRPANVPPLNGQVYYDTTNNVVWIYNGLKGSWMYAAMTTTTSTSSSTTTTSTSTTTTSTSSSTSTSTSTSSTTSTTTTL